MPACVPAPGSSTTSCPWPVELAHDVGHERHPPLALRRLLRDTDPHERGNLSEPQVARAVPGRRHRRTGAIGSALPARAIRAWPVTHTGVWALVRE